MLKRNVIKRTGLSAATIIRLEELGLIHPSRDWNGWRRYSENDVAILQAALRGEIAIKTIRASMKKLR